MNNSPETAAAWLARISSGRSGADSAFVTGLSGHLGAGKTAFVKRVADKLGVGEVVTSPTFVLMKIYGVQGPDVAFKRLVHIDAYRLERREDLEALRFEEVVADPGNLVMIEWPENVGLEKGDMDERMNFEIKDGKYTISTQEVQ